MTSNNQDHAVNSKKISISGPLTAMCFRAAVSVDYIQKAITNGSMSGRTDIQNAHKDAQAEVMAAIEQFESELKRIDNRLQKKTRANQPRRNNQRQQPANAAAPKTAKPKQPASPKKTVTKAEAQNPSKPAAPKAKPKAPKSISAKSESTATVANETPVAETVVS